MGKEVIFLGKALMYNGVVPIKEKPVFLIPNPNKRLGSGLLKH